MANFFSSWAQGIIVAVVIIAIIEMILPSGNNKKYVKVVLGVYLLFNIIAPVINNLTGNLDLNSIINMDEYTKKLESYEVSSSNIIESNNESSILQIYKANIKKDMKAKLEDKGYTVKNIELDISNDENYTINQVTITATRSENDSESNQEASNSSNIVESVNQVETVSITIGNQIKEESNQSSSLAEKYKKEIKEYISSTYEIKEKNIIVN